MFYYHNKILLESFIYEVFMYIFFFFWYSFSVVLLNMCVWLVLLINLKIASKLMVLKRHEWSAVIYELHIARSETIAVWLWEHIFLLFLFPVVKIPVWIISLALSEITTINVSNTVVNSPKFSDTFRLGTSD